MLPSELQGVRHIMPYFGQWLVLYETRDGWYFVPDCGNGEPKKLSESESKDIKNALVEYDKNRMGFFLPHGPAKGGGLDFINDYTNNICMLTAPTRTGKSCAGVQFSLLRTLKCDRSWHCFNHHKIVCPEYRGKRRLLVSSYEWTNVQELWEEYLKWMPRSVANRYLPDWGKYPEEKGRARIIDLKSGKVTKAILGDGSEVLFRCDKQSQGPWEGQRWDDGHFDEQRQRDKFIGYLRGTSNTAGLVQCCFTLTGHVVDDRPDTGASGWIKRELWDGTYSFGRNIGRYNLDIEHTPDVVLSVDEKARLYKQWVEEPEKNKDEDTKRKAEARYFGRWEHGSGLVINNFAAEHHLVPDQIMNMEHHIFKDATKYRGMDHGLGRPATCICAMVFPWGDMLCYREYFQPGKSIPYHVKSIVEACGNKRQKVEAYQDETIGVSFDTFEELFIGEEYHSSVMDSRSFSSPAQESDRTMGQLYNDWGLYCTKARGWNNKKIVPDMLTWFDTNPTRPHLMHQLYTRDAVSKPLYDKWLAGRKGETHNAPKIYFLCGLRHTQSEIHAWAVDPKTGLPKSEHDHIIGGALKYIIAEAPAYWGNMWKAEKTDDTPQKPDTQEYKYCGY